MISNPLRRTTLANIVSATVVTAITAYSIYTNNVDTLLIVLGAGIGYLFKTSNPTQSSAESKNDVPRDK